jgi:hypothetical protein
VLLRLVYLGITNSFATLRLLPMSDPAAGIPADPGVTHWSSWRLADWLHQAKGISVSHDSITVLWRKFCLQPHRSEGFKFSTDPQLDARVRDVVGLYLEPLQNAVVVCADEKPQIQALDRTQPDLGHRRLRRPLERPPAPVHLDQGRRRDPRQHPARQD